MDNVLWPVVNHIKQKEGTMSSTINRRDFLRVGLAVGGAAVLSACGATPTPTPTKVPPTATKAAAAPAATATTAPPVAKPASKITLWSNMITLTRTSGSDPERLAEVRDYIKSKCNVECAAYIPPSGTAAQEKLNLTLGSKTDDLDIFSGGWDVYIDAVQPINKYLDAAGPDIKRLYSQHSTGNIWPYMTDTAGNIWGVPRQGVAQNQHVTWWRTDWLKEFNLPIPSTLEEAEKTFETFRKKYTDCIILTNSLTDLRKGTVGGFTEYGESRWLDPKDGMLKPPVLQPGYKDWATKMNEWYKKGWLFKEAFGSFDVPEVAKTGKVGMFVGWYSRVTILIQQILSAVPGMYFDFNPKGLMGPKGLMNTFNLGGTAAIMVTKKCKDPEAAIRLINWQVQDTTNFLISYYGIPGKDWKWDDAENAKFGKRFYINRLITPETPGARIYAGEFCCTPGPVTEQSFGPNDAQWRRHYEWLRDWNWNLSTGKMPPDVGVPFDVGGIRKAFPGLADFERLVDEETVKFITGVRPLTEWDAFLKQLEAAGLQEWIKAYTAEYKKYKK